MSLPSSLFIHVKWSSQADLTCHIKILYYYKYKEPTLQNIFSRRGLYKIISPRISSEAAISSTLIPPLLDELERTFSLLQVSTFLLVRLSRPRALQSLGIVAISFLPGLLHPKLEFGVISLRSDQPSLGFDSFATQSWVSIFG